MSSVLCPRRCALRWTAAVAEMLLVALLVSQGMLVYLPSWVVSVVRLQHLFAFGSAQSLGDFYAQVMCAQWFCHFGLRLSSRLTLLFVVVVVF